VILRKHVTSAEAGLRLDDAAPRLFPQISKTMARRIIDWGGCTVAGAMVRVASRTVNEGDEIVVGVMEAEHYRDVYLLAPEELIYEDDGFIAVNKPAGINAQRTPYQLKGTMEHAVSRYFADHGIAVGEPVRIVHRLDRGTSGVMIFPKTKREAALVSDLFQQGEVEKVYWALVSGKPPQEWRVEGTMAKIASATYGMATPGRDSRSAFHLLAEGEGAALVECRPETGRTHQLRVHLAHSGHPVVGDKTYGGEPAPRMMLHCRTMGFEAAGRRVAASAPVDEDFRQFCSRCGVNLPGAEASR
jgi:RluA family pseudouridine synthase